MSERYRFRIFSFALISVLFLPKSYAQDNTTFMNAGENHICFTCHGHSKYYYFNTGLDKKVKERMNPYYVIDSSDFYRSNHRNFKCTDCHDPEYATTFPHPGNLRMEMNITCLDCHDGDPVTAKYNFGTISEEFQESVHSAKHSDDFTCWMCHNPHTYRINARSNEDIKEVIAYDNEICLSCHSNVDKYQLLTDKVNPNLIKKHDWLPNQRLHFMNVRCIECHAQYNDELLVSHKILPKEKAVRNCVECHQKNSLLMATLYKYQVIANRRNSRLGNDHVKFSGADTLVDHDGSRLGYFNAIILNQAYIIGANRNYVLNVISVIIMVLVAGSIMFHTILRIRK